MDCQINSCFEEIERMQYSDNVEKEFRVLKSQKIHCYKFGDKSVLVSEILSAILSSLKAINNKLLELDIKVSELDIRISNIEEQIDFNINNNQ
jgi:hypothetical protein